MFVFSVYVDGQPCYSRYWTFQELAGALIPTGFSHLEIYAMRFGLEGVPVENAQLPVYAVDRQISVLGLPYKPVGDDGSSWGTYVV